MNARIVKYSAGSILLILFVSGAMYFQQRMTLSKQRQDFSARLAAEVEKARRSNGGIEIHLKNATDFSWDRVHVFSPYIGAEKINEDLGYAWQPAESIASNAVDSIFWLVFTKNRKVVFYADHPRQLGDFSGIYKQDGYGQSEAIFRFVKSQRMTDDGRAWPFLEWSGENRQSSNYSGFQMSAASCQ